MCMDNTEGKWVMDQASKECLEGRHVSTVQTRLPQVEDRHI